MATNKLSFITDNGADFLDSIPIAELILLHRRYTEEAVLSFDFDTIKNDNTRTLLIFAYFHNITTYSYMLKYWLVFNNEGDVTLTDDHKKATAYYLDVNNTLQKFYNKNKKELNLKKLAEFIAAITKMAQEPVDFDLEGLDERAVAFFYIYFKRNSIYNISLKDDNLRGLGEVSTFAGLYVLVQFWEKRGDGKGKFDIMNDQNALDKIRRVFNNDNVRAFYLDGLNVFNHREEDVFGESLEALQTAFESFSYSPQTDLRRLSILTDRTIVNYFVARLEEIKDPDESQKAALLKYKFYQERISAKHYRNIFTKESIDWYKAWIKKNLLKSTDDLDKLLPNKVEAYAFLNKKFNEPDNEFLPNLIRNAQHINFNFKDAPNVFIYSRLYSAINHKDLKLKMDLVKKAPAVKNNTLEDNLANIEYQMDTTRINIAASDVDGFVGYVPAPIP